MDAELSSTEKLLAEAWSKQDAFDAAGETIRSASLRSIILSSQHPTGCLRLANAFIEGRLDLSYIFTGEGPSLPAIHLELCTFDAPIDLSKSQILDVRLFRCRIPQLLASNTTIHGDLDLSGSQIGSGSGPSLRLEGIRIGGRLSMRGFGQERFQTIGEIRLLGAHIGGNFEAAGALLNGDGTASLSMDGAHIGGSLFFSSVGNWRFEARGSLRLLGLHVGQDLSLRGAYLHGAGEYALSSQRANIAGTIFLTGSNTMMFEAIGGLRLSNMVAGELHIEKARLSPDGRGMTFDLSGSSITGALNLGEILASEGEGRPDGKFDLSGATLGSLNDSIDQSWPSKGYLQLDGLTYGYISPGENSVDGTARLVWLDLQHPAPPSPEKFKPQPYEQLAHVLRGHGYSRAADQIAMRKRDWAIDCQTELGLNAVLTRFMKLVAGHGYERRRAALWTLCWWLLGMAWIYIAARTGVLGFLPDGATEASATVVGSLPDRSTGFLLPVYALELMMPFVEFGQTERNRMIAHNVIGDLLLIWRALYQLFGMLLVTVLGVTLTGLLRTD